MSVMEWLPTAIGVVLFLGAATVYLRGSKDKGTIDTLTRNNAALAERVMILEASDLAKAKQIESLMAANIVLQNTVNSSELIRDLRVDLNKHHASAMEGLQQVHADLAGLPMKFALVMKEQ